MQHRPNRGRVPRPDPGKDAPRPERKTPNLLDQLAAAGLLVRYPIRDVDGREVAACYDVTAAGLRALVGDVNGKPSNGHSARSASYAARYVGRRLCYW
jgi:hypothetical protein